MRSSFVFLKILSVQPFVPTLFYCSRYCSALKSQKKGNKRRENRFEYRALPYFSFLMLVVVLFFKQNTKNCLMLRLTATITNFFLTIQASARRRLIFVLLSSLALMEANK
jgi:hypothetical protein